MRDPAAVVFDLDGVIVDSEGLWDRVRRDLAAAHERPWPASATRDMMGMSSPEWSRYMSETVGIPLGPDEVNARVVETMAAAYRERLPLISGARGAVRRLGRRFRLGLASSSNREIIDAVLEASGLADAFSATVSSEEVGRGKPAPDVYLEAAGRLGVDPTRSVAIEDSSNGIRAAHSAGLTVVCVPHAGYPPAPDALALATRVVASAAELWPSLIRGLSSEARGD